MKSPRNENAIFSARGKARGLTPFHESDISRAGAKVSETFRVDAAALPSLFNNPDHRTRILDTILGRPALRKSYVEMPAESIKLRRDKCSRCESAALKTKGDDRRGDRSIHSRHSQI